MAVTWGEHFHGAMARLGALAHFRDAIVSREIAEVLQSSR
jgi:hypothetical protein